MFQNQHNETLSHDLEDSPSTVTLVFALRHGTLGEPLTIPEMKKYDVSRGRILRIDFHGPVTRQTEMKLRLPYKGPEPRLAETIWGVPKVAKRLGTSLEDIFKWRKKMTNNGQSELKPARKFFNMMDKLVLEEMESGPKANFSSSGPGKPGRKKARLSADHMEWFQDILVKGFHERRFGTTSRSRPYRILHPLKEQIAPVLSGVDSLISAALDAAGIIKPAEILPFLESTFDLFTRGHLRLVPKAEVANITLAQRIEYMNYACQPDSANAFYFAELADLSTELGIGKYWPELLPSLVSSLTGFGELYAGNQRVHVGNIEPCTLPASHVSAPGRNLFKQAREAAKLMSRQELDEHWHSVLCRWFYPPWNCAIHRRP